MNSLMKRLLNAQKSPKIATKMLWGIKGCKIILTVSCCCTINHRYLLTKGTAFWSDYLSQKRIEKRCRGIQKQQKERGALKFLHLETNRRGWDSSLKIFISSILKVNKIPTTIKKVNQAFSYTLTSNTRESHSRLD